MNNLVLIVIVLVLLYAIKSYLANPKVIGARGEKRIAKRNRTWLDDLDYNSYDDIIVPSFDGTTQVDHVIVSRYGIFVIETKHYQGWIFGSADQAQWTQKIYQKTSRFQNPLRQNYKHVKSLSEYLKINVNVLHSVIVFSSSDCKLKTDFPDNVRTLKNYVPYIQSFKDEVLTDPELEVIKSRLGQLQTNSTKELKQAHLDGLRKKVKLTEEGICPKCGGRLVSRTAKSGKYEGKSFLGCSNYPKCKFIKSSN